MQVMGPGTREKIRMIITDLCICLGFPVLVSGMGALLLPYQFLTFLDASAAYIAQGRRYIIFEDIGCTLPINDIWPSYPTFAMWPLLTGVISSVYSALTLRSFYSRRSQVNEFISSDACPMSSQRYTRLMILASTEVVFTIPFSAWVLYQNIINIQPFISWDDTHSDFDVRSTFPSIIWRNNLHLRLYCEFSRWSFVMCAIVFIAFFTFAEESRRKYYDLLGAVATRFGWSLPDKDVPKRGNGTLPPMFPSHKTNDVTILSTITTGDFDDMTEREQTPSSSRFFASSSTIMVSDPEMDLRDTPLRNTVTLATLQPPSADVEGGTVNVV